MKSLTTIIFLLTINCAAAAVLILHEKRAGEQWVLAATWLDTPGQIGDAVTAIEADPDQRRGPSFVILGGVRLSVAPIEIPAGVQWVPDDAAAGQVVVFWHASGSTDPADWHAELFAGLPEAEAFIQAVKADDTRELWDERPLLVDQAWTAIDNPPTIEWILRP